MDGGSEGIVDVPPVRAAEPRAVAVVAVAVALAVAGAILGVRLLTAGADGGATGVRSAGPAVGQEIPVSFGVLEVASVQKVAAPSAHGLGGSLGGQTRGTGGVISAKENQIDIAVTLTNVTGRPVPFSAAQFRLRVGKSGRLLLLSTATLQSGPLQPHAGIEGRLTFVAPRNGARLALEFGDRGRVHPIVVDLGRTAPPGAPAHNH
jgi:hypothetical protein